ncbi:MAG: PKD domain-containing protein [Lewinellaceae bacterium]|nr:PKD domain-containing protein [Lewinellaceae bacterium]
MEVYPACNLNAQPVVIWEKTGHELGTTDPSGFSFVPNEATDWRTEAVSLNQFAGQKIIFRFVGTSDAGNNTYLDNIGIAKYDLSQPFAIFTSSADTICQDETATLQATPSGGNFTNYDWFFGITAQPPSAVGPGPHQVKFLTAGNKSIRLIVSNTVGSDTLAQPLQVLDDPMANFDVQPNGLSVTFVNNSFQGQFYHWSFGDGQVSTDPVPVHVYAAPGTYTAKLTVTNFCGTASKTLAFAVTTTGAALPGDELADIRIQPNPSDGNFDILYKSPGRNTLNIKLFDMQGKLIKTTLTEVLPGANRFSFEGTGLPAGLYRLQIQSEKNVRVFPVAVH